MKMLYQLTILCTCCTLFVQSLTAQILDYSDPDNWAINYTLNKTLPLNPSYTLVGTDTNIRSIVNLNYDTTSNLDIFYVYPTHPKSPWLFNAGAITPFATLPDSMDRIILAQVSMYAQLGRVYAPYYQQANLGTFINPSITVDKQAKALQLAAIDVLAAFEYYMMNCNNGKRVVLVGHSQGSVLLACLLRSLELDLATYQPYLDKILVSVLPGFNSPWVKPGSNTGGRMFEIPVCENETDTKCIISWQSYRLNPTDAIPPVTYNLHHIFNDSMVQQGYHYEDFDSTYHMMKMDPMGYTNLKDIPVVILMNNDYELGVRYSNITTNFVGYENMYAAVYGVAQTNAGLKIGRKTILNDNRVDPLTDENLHPYDHSIFANDVVNLIKQKMAFVTEHPEMLEVNKVTLFPNPVQDVLRINGINEGGQQVQIWTVMGVLVYDEVLLPAEIIDVHHLRSGVYYIKVGEGSNYVGRVVKL